MPLTAEEANWVKLTNRISKYGSHRLHVGFRSLLQKVTGSKSWADEVYHIVSYSLCRGVDDSYESSYEALKLMRDILKHANEYGKLNETGPYMISDYSTTKFPIFEALAEGSSHSLAHYIFELSNAHTKEAYYDYESYVLYYLVSIGWISPHDYEKYLRAYRAAEAACRKRGVI